MFLSNGIEVSCYVDLLKQLASIKSTGQVITKIHVFLLMTTSLLLLSGRFPNLKIPLLRCLNHVLRNQGIDNYANVRSLKGAVADAQRMKDYMQRTFGLPDEYIKELLDGNASRDNIIAELQALANNQSIQRGDAILIYYAGHGELVDAPMGWSSGRPDQKIQSIVPQNFCKDSIDVIPDRTIGNLIDMIEEKYGNNIAVIFDCCHSGSGTRNDDDTVRSTGLENYYISPTVDQNLWQSKLEARGVASATGQAASGLESHIFFSACRPDELARENDTREGGLFTTALLNVFNMTSPDQLTYGQVLERLECIPRQNPQLEGLNRHRIFFNTKATSPHRASHAIYYDSTRGFVLAAGQVHGVCIGAQFTVYETAEQFSLGPILGVLVVTSVYPFDSVMDVQPGCTPFVLLKPGVAIQTKAGVDQELKLYVPFEEAYLPVFEAVLTHMQRAGPNSGRIALVEDRSVAGLAAVLRDENIAFQICDRHIRADGMLPTPYAVKPRVKDVLEALDAVVHYFYHLNRTQKNDLIAKHVTVQLFELGPSETLTNEATGGPVLVPSESGKDLIEGKQIIMDVCEHLSPDYGLCIKNYSEEDLFPNVFYFDDSDLSIYPFFTTHISPFKVEPALPKLGGELTYGYGAGVGRPWGFRINRDNLNFERGFLKIFLSSKAVDLSHIRLDPLDTRGLFEKDLVTTDFWGTIEIPIFLTRRCDCSPKTSKSEQ